MNIRVAHEQGRVPVTVFYVQGQINLGSAPQLEKTARAEYDSGMRDLLIDLSEATSLTSAGLRSLVVLYRLLGDASADASGSQRKPAHLKLLNLPPDLRQVIQIAGFDRFIEVYDDLPAAVASFGAQEP
jgi:anti-sigma B factor antagonist